MMRYSKKTVKSRYSWGGNETEHVITFDSYSEFIRACHDKKPGSKNAGFIDGYTYDDFAGCSYDTAHRFATVGYADGAKLLKLKLGKLDVASHIAKPEMYFDVEGSYGFDMGLVMSGEPESSICYRDSETDIQKSNVGPIVNILVNTVMSGGIPKDIIAHRGAAIVSLVNALEAAGKRCQIDVICSANVYGCGLLTHKFPLKNAGESLAIENIAFALSHPAIERRFNFIALELFPKSVGWKRNMGYGGPRDVETTGYDVYVPMLHSHDANWQTIETVTAWVKAELHKMGISLDSDIK